MPEPSSWLGLLDSAWVGSSLPFALGSVPWTTAQENVSPHWNIFYRTRKCGPTWSSHFPGPKTRLLGTQLTPRAGLNRRPRASDDLPPDTQSGRTRACLTSENRTINPNPPGVGGTLAERGMPSGLAPKGSPTTQPVPPLEVVHHDTPRDMLERHCRFHEQVLLSAHHTPNHHSQPAMSGPPLAGDTPKGVGPGVR